MATTRINPPEYSENIEEHTSESETHFYGTSNPNTCNNMNLENSSNEADEESGEDTTDYVRRQRFSSQELKTLDGVFRRCRFPSREIKLDLAQKLHTTPRRIQTWFQNKRAARRRAEERHALGGSPGDNDTLQDATPPSSFSTMPQQEIDDPTNYSSSPGSAPLVLEPVPLSNPTAMTLKMQPESPYRSHPLLSHDYPATHFVHDRDNNDI